MEVIRTIEEELFTIAGDLGHCKNKQSQTARPSLLLRPDSVAVDVAVVGEERVEGLTGRYVLADLQHEGLAHGVVVVAPDGEPADLLAVPLLDVGPPPLDR